MTRHEDHTLEALDGATLGARLFTPAGAPRGVIVVHGALGVPQRYYTRFAAFAADEGFAVLTYDYRGVGASRPERLRGFQATATDWGTHDWGGAMAFAAHAFPDAPLLAVCHSFGGQALALAPEARWLSGVVTVGTQLGSLRHWPWPARLGPIAAMRVLLPASVAALGYWSGRVGVGEDLPRGVAQEWAKWCLSPNYLLDHVGGAADALAALDAPITVYGLTDDFYAPEAAVTAFAALLPPERVTHRRVHPHDVGAARIGHFGFFRERFADTLWVEALETLAANADARTVSATG